MSTIFKREPGFYRRLLALALPLLVQNLITNSLGLVDTFMVGALGEGPLAGVTLANIPLFVVQLMIFGVQSGSSVLASQYKGRGDLESINRVMGIGMYVAGGITLIFALVTTLLPGPFLSLFGSDPEVVAVAARYARIVGWSYFLDSFVQVYIAAHRSMGNANRGMYILAVSVAGNTFLNWVFIFGNLGAPRLGVEGAALATLLARALSFTVMAAWAVLDRNFRIRPALLLRPGLTMARRFIRYATPVMCNETLWGLGTSLFPTILGHMSGSREILAAYAIAGNITNLCTVGVFAMSSTTTILVGQEIGAGRAGRVRSLGLLLDALAFLFGAAMGGLFLAALHLAVIPFLYPMFGLSAEARRVCTLMLTVSFCFMPLLAFDTVNIVGVLRGGGDVRMATVIDLLPLWAVALPLAAIAGLVLKADVLWVCLAMQSENLVKCVFGFLRLRGGSWVNDVTRAEPE